MILRAFRSFYQSGADFSEKILPKAIGKQGGVALGAAVGLASVLTGACFFYAIPLSVPMFLVAHGMFAGKGALVATAATVFLGSVGSVITSTGLGMVRAGVKEIFSDAKKLLRPKPETIAAPVPGKQSAFDGAATSRAGFNQQAAAPASPYPAQPSVVVAGKSFSP